MPRTLSSEPLDGVSVQFPLQCHHRKLLEQVHNEYILHCRQRAVVVIWRDGGTRKMSSCVQWLDHRNMTWGDPTVRPNPTKTGGTATAIFIRGLGTISPTNERQQGNARVYGHQGNASMNGHQVFLSYWLLNLKVRLRACVCLGLLSTHSDQRRLTDDNSIRESDIASDHKLVIRSWAVYLSYLISSKDTEHSSDLSHSADLERGEDNRRAVLTENNRRAVLNEDNRRAVLTEDNRRAVLTEDNRRAVLNEDNRRAVLNEDNRRAVLTEDNRRAVLNEDNRRAVLTEDNRRAVLTEDNRRAVLNEDNRRAVLTEDNRRAVLTEDNCRAVLNEDNRRAVLTEDNRRAVLNEDNHRAVLNEDNRRAVLNKDNRRAVLTEDNRRAVLNEDNRRAVLTEDNRRAVLTEDNRNIKIKKGKWAALEERRGEERGGEEKRREEKRREEKRREGSRRGEEKRREEKRGEEKRRGEERRREERGVEEGRRREGRSVDVDNWLRNYCSLSNPLWFLCLPGEFKALCGQTMIDTAVTLDLVHSEPRESSLDACHPSLLSSLTPLIPHSSHPSLPSSLTPFTPFFPPLGSTPTVLVERQQLSLPASPWKSLPISLGVAAPPTGLPSDKEAQYLSITPGGLKRLYECHRTGPQCTEQPLPMIVSVPLEAACPAIYPLLPPSGLSERSGSVPQATAGPGTPLPAAVTRTYVPRPVRTLLGCIKAACSVLEQRATEGTDLHSPVPGRERWDRCYGDPPTAYLWI
ncbi:hypothetical protein P4O66_001529 [Electrophorus voltai]|uniref:Uncharacterized protein n=1 Tax=Electrophorus voltai TaxID=2609070 RepID=A0AAD8Z739_9TELE|nr:hypothetical protein P4O66_001529 [Electrophorus voltai]